MQILVHWYIHTCTYAHTLHAATHTHCFSCSHIIKAFFSLLQLNDEQEKKEDERFLEALSELDDEFLAEYRLRRIEEMRKSLGNM